MAEDPEVLQLKLKKLNDEKVAFYKKQLKRLGWSDKKLNKYDSIEVLEAFLNEEEEKEEKKKEEDEEEDKKKEEKSNAFVRPPTRLITKVNAGRPTYKFPDGSTTTATPMRKRFNKAALARFADPMKVPRYEVKVDPRSRINALPPTAEEPYWRVIA